MDRNALILAQAMEKAAACGKPHVGDKPMENYMRSKAKKKATIIKESLDANRTSDAVEVTRVDVEKAAELHDALQILAGGEKSAAAQDAKQKEEEKPTKPGTLRLDSASDEQSKKTPEKKPEKGSENEVQYKEKTMKKKSGALAAVQQPGRLEALKEALKRLLKGSAGVAQFGGAVGGGMGLLSGATDPEEGRGRLASALRRALAYGTAGAAGGLGGGLGTAYGMPGMIGGTALGSVSALRGMNALLGDSAVTPKHQKRYGMRHHKKSSFREFVKKSMSTMGAPANPFLAAGSVTR